MVTKREQSDNDLSELDRDYIAWEESRKHITSTESTEVFQVDGHFSDGYVSGNDIDAPTAETKFHPPDEIEIGEEAYSADFDGIPAINTAEGQTDLSNSRRFVAMFGERTRYCHPWKKWLVFHAGRWRNDNVGFIRKMAKAVADRTWNEASLLSDRNCLNFAAKTASSSGINSMLKLAESDLPIAVDDMDADPWLLNFENGTLDLRSGKLRDHDPTDFITKIVPHSFDWNAECPNWENCLLAIFDGKTDTVEFFQRLLGYGLTGDVREQILPICWGTGSNGKSTVINAVTYAMGTDYIGTLPHSLLMVSRGERHPTELTTLHGKRLAIGQESDEGGRLSEALVKQLTGSDRITARGMREDFWEFEPTHKILLCTNHRPQVRGTDHAIWRRLLLIPFTVRFDGNNKDKSMPEKLQREATGIMRWMVEGCLEWQRKGLNEPEAVRVATAEYRNSEDTLAAFISECCLHGKQFKVKATPLYEAYKKWCEAANERTLSQRKFGEAMTERQFERQSNNGIWYLDIGLKDDRCT